MSPDTITLSSVQNRAQERFAETGWPAKKSEAWKYTSLDALASASPQPANDISGAVAMPAGVAGEQYRLVFQGGLFRDDLSDALPAGVQLVMLGEDERALAAIDEIGASDNLVPRLTVAKMTAGISLRVAQGIVVDRPIMLQFVGGAPATASHPVIYIDVGDAAHFAYAEHHETDNGLSAPFIVVRVGAGATLDHIKLQLESATTQHLGLTCLSLGERADVNSMSLSLGGALSRLETHVRLDGEYGELGLSSIYLGKNNQHHDMTTRVAHEVANCNSRQIIRGVLDDKARGVFQGQVRVAPHAQKTDGQQMSRALLLSRDAEADAKPELEIFADDVVCSHGATVGELDETHLFYLRSRGIDEAEARAMLIDAFLIEAVAEIRHQGFADLFSPFLSGWQVPRKG
ncbi:MAG: Fe-S cluster assembly protein SufD [Alphaproteobacteria bacterium]|jgi:Fe-S cluster assembly protein SufD|nr:Fe-S cluster assembly protein SufD [Alphaproteobacteria bacterium]MDG1030303.1 Fe-S cluster assembly protein SufD [Alphaproteobacteria bacterium]